MPRSIHRLVSRFRREARAEAHTSLLEVAQILTDRHNALSAQGGQHRRAPFSAGDVAAAIRHAVEPQTPPADAS